MIVVDDITNLETINILYKQRYYHELMVPRRIMWPSRSNVQFDVRCIYADIPPPAAVFIA